MFSIKNIHNYLKIKIIFFVVQNFTTGKKEKVSIKDKKNWRCNIITANLKVVYKINPGYKSTDDEDNGDKKYNKSVLKGIWPFTFGNKQKTKLVNELMLSDFDFSNLKSCVNRFCQLVKAHKVRNIKGAILIRTFPNKADDKTYYTIEKGN